MSVTSRTRGARDMPAFSSASRSASGRPSTPASIISSSLSNSSSNSSSNSPMSLSLSSASICSGPARAPPLSGRSPKLEFIVRFDMAGSNYQCLKDVGRLEFASDAACQRPGEEKIQARTPRPHHVACPDIRHRKATATTNRERRFISGSLGHMAAARPPKERCVALFRSLNCSQSAPQNLALATAVTVLEHLPPSVACRVFCTHRVFRQNGLAFSPTSATAAQALPARPPHRLKPASLFRHPVILHGATLSHQFVHCDCVKDKLHLRMNILGIS